MKAQADNTRNERRKKDSQVRQHVEEKYNWTRRGVLRMNSVVQYVTVRANAFFDILSIATNRPMT